MAGGEPADAGRDGAEYVGREGGIPTATSGNWIAGPAGYATSVSEYAGTNAYAFPRTTWRTKPRSPSVTTAGRDTARPVVTCHRRGHPMPARPYRRDLRERASDMIGGYATDGRSWAEVTFPRPTPGRAVVAGGRRRTPGRSSARRAGASRCTSTSQCRPPRRVPLACSVAARRSSPARRPQRGVRAGGR